WLESHGRRVVNGRRAVELDVSKAAQLSALRAAGFDVPRTLAVAGAAALPAAATRLPVPFIGKHNQGGQGLGVRLSSSHDEFDAYLASPGYLAPVDGIILLQEYVPAAAPFITRVEIVGGSFVYAITADTARGGFELCPADACTAHAGTGDAGTGDAGTGDAGTGDAGTGDAGAGDAGTGDAGTGDAGTGDAGTGDTRTGGEAPWPALFALREGFDHPLIGRYSDCAVTAWRSPGSISSRPRTAAWSPTTSTPPPTTTRRSRPRPRGPPWPRWLRSSGGWSPRSPPRPARGPLETRVLTSGSTVTRFGYWMPVPGGLAGRHAGLAGALAWLIA